jgi:hypothetical protein
MKRISTARGRPRSARLSGDGRPVRLDAAGHLRPPLAEMVIHRATANGLAGRKHAGRQSLLLEAVIAVAEGDAGVRVRTRAAAELRA